MICQKWINIRKKYRTTIINLGCGNGAFSSQIIEKCYPSKLYGIDPSEAQIEFAKNRNFAQNVKFQTGDAMSLPYESDSFDMGEFIKIIHCDTIQNNGFCILTKFNFF